MATLRADLKTNEIGMLTEPADVKTSNDVKERHPKSGSGGIRPSLNPWATPPEEIRKMVYEAAMTSLETLLERMRQSGRLRGAIPPPRRGPRYRDTSLRRG